MSSNSQQQQLMDMMRSMQSMQSKLDSMVAKVEAFLQEEAKRATQSLSPSTTQPATQEATQEPTNSPPIMTMTPPAMAETPVKPSSAIIKPEVINLPPPDQFQLRMYQIFLHCFRLDPEADPRQVYSELRCGLSDALVEFPFFAGRVVKYDVARDRIQINMSSDDGVAFKYNDLTPSLDFWDLEQGHFPPSKFEGLALTPVDQVFPAGAEDPALLLQANFIKGGLLLATCLHHSTSDAAGWTGFIKSWAKHTAAASTGSRIAPHQSPEILDRAPLFQVTKHVALEHCEQLVKVEDVTERINKMRQYFIGLSRQTISRKIVNACWYFSSERLRALKAAAQPTNEADPWVSTNDALCALLWRHVTQARELKQSAHETTTIQIPCSIRGRCSPELQPEYVGNAIVHAHCSCPIQDLCSTSSNGLSLAAGAIRKAIDRVDEPTVRNIYGIIDSLPTIRAARYKLDLAPGPDFFVTTLAGFDWHSFDWGNHLGRMVRNRSTFRDYVTGVMVLPRLGDGGLEVYMGHELEVIERLRLDETFTKFAELRCH